MNDKALKIISKLQLEPLPNEGGFFRRVYAGPEIDKRSIGTSIYYLVSETNYSHWHKLDCDEIYHFYSGAPLQLWLIDDKKGAHKQIIGTPECYQFTVPAGTWQGSFCEGSEGYSLVGTTCIPGYLTEKFQMPSATLVTEWIKNFPTHEKIISKLSGKSPQ